MQYFAEFGLSEALCGDGFLVNTQETPLVKHGGKHSVKKSEVRCQILKDYLNFCSLSSNLYLTDEY